MTETHSIIHIGIIIGCSLGSYLLGARSGYNKALEDVESDMDEVLSESEMIRDQAIGERKPADPHGCPVQIGDTVGICAQPGAAAYSHSHTVVGVFHQGGGYVAKVTNCVGMVDVGRLVKEDTETKTEGENNAE